MVCTLNRNAKHQLAVALQISILLRVVRSDRGSVPLTMPFLGRFHCVLRTAHLIFPATEKPYRCASKTSRSSQLIHKCQCLPSGIDIHLRFLKPQDFMHLATVSCSCLIYPIVEFSVCLMRLNQML